MVDSRVVEITWLENKFRKTSQDWTTISVAIGAGSEDLNIGSDCNIKHGKTVHCMRLLQIFANEEEAAASMNKDSFPTVLGLAKTILILSLNQAIPSSPIWKKTPISVSPHYYIAFIP